MELTHFVTGSVIFGKCIQYIRIDFYMKKTKKRTKNDGSHAVIVVIIPDNHQQASVTCWEIGGFGWGKKRVKIRENGEKKGMNPEI